MTVYSRYPLWRRTLRSAGSRLFHWAENNGNSNLEHNGELWLLRCLLRAHVAAGGGRAFVAIDAGANAGEYTRVILSQAAQVGCDAIVHAFEPSPACASQLRDAFAGQFNVRLVAAALANTAGDANLFAGGSGSSQASLISRDSHRAAGLRADVTVPLLRLGDYLDSNSIQRVDLLKLDVEGSELAALQGLQGRLSPAVVPVIQFEYGGTTLDAGVTLKELFKLLTAAGYRVAKLFPDGIEPRAYSPWMEHYAYANFVALAPESLQHL